MDIFTNINDTEKKQLLKLFDAKIRHFSKDSTILSNVSNTSSMCIISFGSAAIIRIDYHGNKTIIETLNTGDIFESRMFNLDNNELYITSLEETEVILIDYNVIFTQNRKTLKTHEIFLENLLKITIDRLNHSYERIQILTKKTIRDKLLEYFRYISFKKNSKKFKMPISFSDLASYLAIDRSSLMREIKHLKEDGFIEVDKKVIKLNY